MVNEKHAFAAVALLVVAFIGFLIFSSGSHAAPTPSDSNYAAHPIDNSIPTTQDAPANVAPPAAAQLQEVSVRALSSGGYNNPSPTVKAGEPVQFDFSADSGAGCGRQLIIDGLGSRVNLVSRNGETVSATFTPPSPGQYRFHCGMNLFRGVLIAT